MFNNNISPKMANQNHNLVLRNIGWDTMHSMKQGVAMCKKNVGMVKFQKIKTK
jgi:hypothetical protein